MLEPRAMKTYSIFLALVCFRRRHESVALVSRLAAQNNTHRPRVKRSEARRPHGTTLPQPAQLGLGLDHGTNAPAHPPVQRRRQRGLEGAPLYPIAIQPSPTTTRVSGGKEGVGAACEKQELTGRRGSWPREKGYSRERNKKNAPTHISPTPKNTTVVLGGAVRKWENAGRTTSPELAKCGRQGHSHGPDRSSPRHSGDNTSS